MALGLLTGSCMAAAEPRFFTDWVTTLPGAAGSGVSPDSVAVGLDGSVYVAGGFGTSRTTGTLDLGITNLVTVGSRDAFAARFDARGRILWAQHFGGPQRDYAHRIGVDAAGNCYVLGSFFEGCSIAGRELVGRGNQDLLLAKFSPTGELLWVTTSGSSNEDYAMALQIDPEGNPIVLLLAGASFMLSGSDLPVGTDLILLKYSTTGGLLWSQTAAGKDGRGVAPESMTLDAAGNIYVTGGFWATADFGGATLSSPGWLNGRRDLFLAKYAPDGSLILATQVGAGSVINSKVIVHDADHILIAAAFWTGDNEYIVMGNQRFYVESGLSRDYLLASLNAVGVPRWAIRVGGVDNQGLWFGKLLTDAAGNLYGSGWFTGKQDFSGVALGDAGDPERHQFLAKFSPEGGTLWAERLDADVPPKAHKTFPGDMAWFGGDSLIHFSLASGTLALGDVLLPGTDDVYSLVLAKLDVTPRLTHRLQNGLLTLEWPGSLRDFVLQSSPSLGEGARWTPHPGVPRIQDGRFLLTEPSDGGDRFFRLFRP